MTTPARRHGLLGAMAAFALFVSGCRSESPPSGSTDHVEHAPSGVPAANGATLTALEPSFVQSVTLDGGAGDGGGAHDAGDAGPNCTGAGDPTMGVDAGDGGASCTGALGQATFQWAICSCNAMQFSGTLNTDGFDSTRGSPDGGVGSNVGANGNVTWSSTASFGGNLWTPGNVSESGGGVVRGDVHVGGSVTASAALTVDGNAYAVKTLPKNVTVLGTVSHPTSVAAPCNCANPVPIGSIVAAHSGSNNDNASIGLLASAGTGSNPAHVTLPCGNYYLTAITSSASLTIEATGHTALYVGGNIASSGALVFQIDTGATLDLFVAGNFAGSGALTLGSTAAPAHCRAFVAGSSLAISGNSNIGCNIYAPNAAFDTSGAMTVYGSVFASSVAASGNTTVHYDTSILNAGGECCTASKCDDGNPCTVDACNGDGTCSHTPATNGTACSGTNKCEQTYACQAGVCTGSNPVMCTASDQCHTAGTCNTSTGACSNPTAANGTTCNDGNACTQTDACQSGTCTGSNPVTCTASDQCHVAGTCNTSTGVCSNPTAANGTTCDDGNACTLTDACQGGACTGSRPVTCTASDQCHTAGTCNTSTGVCSNPTAANGTTCNDGNACTQTDTCQAGTCAGSNPVTCTASDQCHVAGTCNTSTGACSNPTAANGTTCNDGNGCTQTDTCQTGTCTGSNPVTCTASDACHVAGTCDPTSGACSNPAAPNGTSCVGTNKCNQSYACQAGACTGSSPVTCPGPTSQIVATASMPDARTRHAATALANGGVLVTGGTLDGSTPLQTTLTYRAATGTWTPAASMSVARFHHAAVALATGKVLVAGGVDENGAALKAVEVYDPASDTWASAASTTAARASNQGVLLRGGNVLLVGNAANSPSSEIYDPTSNSWSAVAGYVTGGGNSELLLLLADGRAFVSSGLPGGANGPTGGASIYDPTANGWTAVAEPPATLAGPVGALLPSGHVLMAGGAGSSGPSPGALTYDPLTNAWASTGQMSAARTNGAAAVLPNGTVLVVGTATGADLYDPNAGTWQALASSATAPYASATLTASGAILVTGAADASGNTSAALASAPDAACTQATCDPQSGLCAAPTAKAEGTACSDSDACLKTHACHLGYCVGSNPVTCAATTALCKATECDPTTGACSALVQGDGTACNDGNACTLGESCQSGTCAGNPVVCSASDQCHAAGVCDPASGTCSNPAAADGTACTSSNACMQTGACNSGTCNGSNPVTCTASDQCHAAGTCDPSTGACSNPAATDGTACTGSNKCDQTYVCSAGMCAGSNPVTCTASDQCHVAGTCDPTSGTCSNPAATDGTTCNDGNACTQTDACQSGACTGTSPVACTASDQCHAAGTCDPSTGACSNPAATDGTACTGSNKCDQTYACSAGTCAGSNPVTCTASDQCHVVGTCDPTSGTCSNPAAIDGTTCNDGNACTQTDACKSGTCNGSNPVTCTASDPCHAAGTCDSSTGACSNPTAPDGTACTGSNKCDQTYACSAGTCAGSNPVTCTASDPCHMAGTCNTATGVCSSGSAAPDGTACVTSGSVAGVCSGGACQATCASGLTLCGAACVNTQTDVNNCGGCGAVCTGPSPVCNAGACACIIATGQGNPFGLATDGHNVYWTNHTTVAQASIRGGEVVTLVSGRQNALDLATDGVNVYWMDAAIGSIMQTPVGGGPSVALATGQQVTGNGPPQTYGPSTNIGTDGVNVYWTDWGSGQVMSVSVRGAGTPIVLASGQNHPQSLALDPLHVYWVDTLGSVWSASKGGGSVTMLTSPVGTNAEGGIAVDGTGVYWTGENDGVVRKTSFSGAADVFASGQRYPYGIQSDGTRVYWADYQGNAVMSAAVDGTGATTLAAGQSGPTDIALGGDNVYWTDQLDGTIRCAAKIGGFTPPCTATSCDDGNACTSDVCDEFMGCRHAPLTDGTACDDGNGCTQTDACMTGKCVGSDPVICAATDVCSPGHCDPASGACTGGPQPDGATCTTATGVAGICGSGACNPQCAHNYTACGPACVDITSDACNCGGCGVTCQAGIQCVSGVCQDQTVIAAGQSVPGGLATDGRTLYWTNGTNVLGARVGGTNLSTLVTGALPPGAVSWWPAESTATDVVGTNDGLFRAGPSFGPGRVGQGFTFSSDGDGVVIPSNPNLDVQNPGFTATFWMNGIKNQPQAHATVFEKSAGGSFDSTGWAFQLASSSGLMTFDIGDGINGDVGIFPGVQGTVDVLDGQFHYVAGTWDGTSIRLYIDGVLQPGTAQLSQGNRNTRSVNIGFAWGNGTTQAFFRGTVDEPMVFNRALSATEIGGILGVEGAGTALARLPSASIATDGVNAYWLDPSDGTVNMAPVRGGPARVLAGGQALAGNAPAIVGWWGAEGNAADSISGDNGALQGGAAFAPGQVGQGFTFASNSDGVIIPSNPVLDVRSTGFTADFWVRGIKNQPQSLATAFEKSCGFVDSTGWAFRIDGATGLPKLDVGNGSSVQEITASVDVLDGNFHHVAGTWDGSTLRTFVDGVLQQNTNGLSGPAANTRSVNIGFAWGGGTPQQFFRGTIDEAHVFDRALSTTEIGAVLAAGGAGRPIAPQPPTNIATDGMRVYWTSYGSGSVMSLALGSSTAPIAIATGQNGPQGLAMDASNVYWVNTDGSVSTVPQAGGPATTLVPPGVRNPMGGVAVDATSVYFTNALDQTVRKVPLGGGAASLLANNQLYPYGIRSDGIHAFWTDYVGGAVMEAVPDGSGATSVATGQSGPSNLVLDATNVYWTNPLDGTVRFASKLCTSAANCSDGNDCTVDTCGSSGECAHTFAANGSACNDGNACTRTDMCLSGSCVGANPVPCIAANNCQVATCNPATGTCSSVPIGCTASDQCHATGACNPATGTCSNPPAPNGTVCSDGNDCTAGDSCQGGACAPGLSTSCSSSDPCHVASACDSTGKCPLSSSASCAREQVVLDPVNATFYRHLGQESFGAQINDVPAFSQTFPAIEFDPPYGTVPNNTSNVDVNTRPFTDVTMDGAGNFTGTIVAQGNGLAAGVGPLTSFEAVFTSKLEVAHAGDLTLDVMAGDGFLLGIGNGAVRVNGTYANAPASNTSAFYGYPLVAAWNQAGTTAQHFPITVHFPQAGSYSYELDYFDCCSKQASLVVAVQNFVPDTSPLSIYVAYADSNRPPVSIFPFPWAGSPSVTFVGTPPPAAFDCGAVRFDNGSDQPIVLDSVTVDVGQKHFDLWTTPTTPLVVPPHAVTILAQTMTAQNFDTSDQPITCTPSGVIPRVNVTQAGVITSFADTAQILNTRGIDAPNCVGGNANESEPWTRIGGSGSGIDVPLAAAGTLALTPNSPQNDATGGSQTLTVGALDASGGAVAGLPVTFTVYGSNTRSLSATTDGTGVATVSYVGSNAGIDNVSAVAFVGGAREVSNATTITWSAGSSSGGSSSGGSSGGSPGPLSVTAETGLVLTMPANNVPLSGVVTAPANLPTTIQWFTASGPAAAVFADTANPATTASFPVTGVYQLLLQADDTESIATAQIQVTVVDPNYPPVANAGPDQVLTAPTLSTSLTGTATDDGLPAGATLSYQWSVISAPHAVTLAAPTNPSTGVSFAYPGVYVFQLTVSDGQKVGTAQTTVTVKPPSTASTSAPVISFGGLADDAVITKPTPITATISEGSWALETRLGGRDDVSTDYTLLASGNGPVAGTTIATFDPTLLLNGIYTVRLSATTSAGETSTSVSVAVDGRMKVGDFTLDFTDLEVPVSGLPFRVDRIYDSRDKTVGDFGVGWKLGVTDIRIEKSGKIGAHWNEQFTDLGLIAQFCLEPTQASSVTITFPNGREYRFRPRSFPECILDGPVDPDHIDWVCTSDPYDPTIQLHANGEGSAIVVPGGDGSQLWTFGSDGNSLIWDPRQFTLTTEDGTAYDIDQDKGVTAIRDRHGNTITVAPGGIFSSTGKSILFNRDGQNRITTTTDPSGASLTYAYDQNGDLTAATDRDGNITHFAYTGNHYLQEVLDPLGRGAVRSDYDPNNRLISQTDAAGHTVQFNANIPANAETVTDRLGHLTAYVYNDKGDITQKTDATGAVWRYAFDPFGNKLSETDPLGHTTSTTYDGQNDPLTQTDALGNVTASTYNQYRQVLTTTDPLGHVTTNVYDGLGNRTSTKDAIGNVTTYTYDRFGNAITKTDPLGQVTNYAYDAAGNVTSTTDPLGHVTTDTYDANGKKLSESVTQTPVGGTPQTLTTTYQYDPAERLIGTTYPEGTTTSTTYTPTGKRATSTDELGRTTTYAYDLLDRLVTTTRPDGTSETQTYDLENRRATSTNASSNTTAYAYDNVGRLTQTTFADGSTALTTYDPAGRATATTDELGHVTQTAYDAAGRRTSATDPAGGVTQTAYDAAGNFTSTTDPLGHVTSIAYDADNRQVATLYADGTADSTQYDAAGRMVAKTDVLGRTTHFAYDAVGRLSAVTDALAQVTQYTYDEIGHRVSQTDANGHATSFAYDTRGRETKRTLSDGSSESKTYDVAGELTTRTDFIGQVTGYTYDPIGRPLSRAYPDHSVVSFTYTPDGRRATAVDARGTTTYAYDARRRLVQETYPDGRLLTFAYDPHGERTGVTAKIGSTSLTTTTTYDPAGRPNQITDPLGRAFAVSYDAAGNRSAIQYPNTTTTSYAYDALNRLTNLATVQGPAGSTVTVQSYAYTLDLAGKRTQTTEADGTVRSYTYDSIDRLTGETVTGSLNYAKAFAYDSVGNRSTQTTTGSGAATVAYAYDSRDRLLTENGTTYAYDANGNVTIKSGEAGYAWDFENRLTTATMTASGTVGHAYDADGNRVQTTVTPASGPAVASNFLVDTSGGLSQVVADTDGSGNLTAYYVRVGDELLAVMRPGTTAGTWTTRFVHSDGLGSVRVLTDESGTTIDSRGYEAFGTKNVEAGNDPLAYGFAGEPFDGTSKLAYHRARWMDARVGRFEGMDPVSPLRQPPGQYHSYTYAGDMPTMAVDPTGREPFELLFGKAVEEQIFADFQKKVPGGITNSAIQNLLGGWSFARGVNPLVKAFFGIGILGRPDLANPSPPIPSTPYIFEVKPLSLEWAAELEVEGYLGVLNALDDRAWRAGTVLDYEPPHEITVLGVDVKTWVADSGVVVYYADPGQRQLRQASGIIAVGAAIGVAILVADTVVAASEAALE